MARVIEIEPQIRRRQTVTILCPQDDLREIIDQDMGIEAARLYDEVISDLEIEYAGQNESDGDDYEKIADGYRNRLVDVMNELQEIVMQKRMNRRRLEKLWQQLNNEL